MSATILTITDLTRMSGNHVCIAGITDDQRIIRPELDQVQITEDWLFSNGKLIIKPFARVKFDLIEHRPDPPHTEDWIVHPDRKKFDRELTMKERHELLENIAYPSVVDVFEAKIGHEYGHGYFIQHGHGTRSLGTVRLKSIDDFVHAIYNEAKLDYRLGFIDSHDETYRLGITDLAFRYYVDSIRTNKGLSFEQVSKLIINILKETQIFLRIGLARATNPRNPGFCNLQINGVYTFPDYLEGRTFADFKRP